MAETRQGRSISRSREDHPHDPLDELRAAVRADRLKLERLPMANVELKSRTARKR